MGIVVSGGVSKLPVFRGRQNGDLYTIILAFCDSFPQSVEEIFEETETSKTYKMRFPTCKASTTRSKNRRSATTAARARGRCSQIEHSAPPSRAHRKLVNGLAHRYGKVMTLMVRAARQQADETEAADMSRLLRGSRRHGKQHAVGQLLGRRRPA